MYIKQVTLKNFKIFNHHEIKFNRGLNIIVGRHASGKSTIIDAIRFIIDPQYEASSETVNLHSFMYKPPTSNYSKTGYVELSLVCRNTDNNIFNVRRNFSNLSVIQINKRQEMKMREFYHFLRSHTFLTNSFMSSFIDLELLYKVDNNDCLFKHIVYCMSEYVKLHANIRNMLLSSQIILKTKLGKLTGCSKQYLSILCDHETNLDTRLQSANFFNEYINNLRIQRNIHRRLQCELDKLNYLEELQCELFDVHEKNINNFIYLERNIRMKCLSSNFIDITEFVQNIMQQLNNLHSNVNDIYSLDFNSIVSYPMQLDAQQQIYRYVMNLRRTLKIKNLIIKSITGDIKLLNSIIKRKRSKQANLTQAIESNLCDFVNIKNILEDSSRALVDHDDDITFQPFKHSIEFFLNDRLFYFKMKLILCFDYQPCILNELQLVIKINCNRRVIPVFNCIRFKNDFVIKDNLYEYLKPVLDWIIIDTVSAPFIVPQESCHITWVPTNSLYAKSNTDIILDTEFQYIWEGIDFEALRQMKVLTELEEIYLKYIFYQRQLTIKYEISLLFGGNQSRPNDITELCDTLQSCYRISNFRDDYKSLTNIFINQTHMPIQLFSFKEHLDAIILIVKNLNNDIKILLSTTEELQYHKEDLKLKMMCLDYFNDDSNFVVQDFDPPRYRNSMDNIDQLKIKLEKLRSRSSSLNFKFNKLFLDVYLPLDEMVIIVPNSQLRIQQMVDWNKFAMDLEKEFWYCEHMSKNNLLIISEVGATLRNRAKIFLTEDEEFSCLINGNGFKKNELFLSKCPFYNTLQKIAIFIPFHDKVFYEINQAIKVIERVQQFNFTRDFCASVKIQVHDQVSKGIEIANDLLENFNHKIKIGFSDGVDKLDESINEKHETNILKSFQFIIQKKVNHYQEQSTMTSLSDEMPTQGDFYLAKLMFLLGVSLNNRHKLLCFDDISVMLNKNKDLLINISQLEEIYQRQQVIMTCNPAEIPTESRRELNEYMRVPEFEFINFINIDGCV